MTRIEYTDADGRKVSFDSESPEYAMQKLRGIRGYSGGIMDSAAAGMAGAWRSRFNPNADDSPSPRHTVIHGSHNLDWSNRRVSNVEVRGNKLVQTSRKEFVDADGRVRAIGTERRTFTDLLSDMEYCEVVTGIDFSTKDGPLKITVTKERVLVKKLGGGKHTDTMSIGTGVKVHNEASSNDHSYVYVLSSSNLTSNSATAGG